MTDAGPREALNLCRGWCFGQVEQKATGQETRLGRALVDGSLRWFLERGLEEARVVTQGRNAGAMRLYERSGFTTDQVRFISLWWACISVCFSSK